MNDDVYAALLTAGNNLQPIVGWIVGHWTGLVALAVAVAALWVVWWSIHDDTQRADRLECRPEPAEPGRDVRLYLDCVAIYDDCDELDRLREAIHQHRKENPRGRDA